MKRRFDELGIELPVPQRRSVLGKRGARATRRGDLPRADAEPPARSDGLAGSCRSAQRGAAARRLFGGRRRKPASTTLPRPRRSCRRCPTPCHRRATCRPSWPRLLRRGGGDRARTRRAARPAGSPSASGRRPTGRAAAGAARRGLFRRHGRASAREPSEVPAEGRRRRLERLADPPEVVVRVRVTPGPRYLFGEVRGRAGDNPGRVQAPSPKDLGLVPGEPARTQPVIDAEAELLRRGAQGRLRAGAPGEREAVVDHDARADGRDAAAGARAGGRVRRASASPAPTASIRTSCAAGCRSPPGERYDPALVTEGQTNLFDTNLFSTIIIRGRPRQLTPEGFLDIRLRAAPAAAALDRRRGRLPDRHRAGRPRCSGSTATCSAPASASAPSSTVG